MLLRAPEPLVGSEIEARALTENSRGMWEEVSEGTTVGVAGRQRRPQYPNTPCLTLNA